VIILKLQIEDCDALALCGRRAILISKDTKYVEASALRAEPSVHYVECLQNVIGTPEPLIT
jgi:hypothetical protein